MSFKRRFFRRGGGTHLLRALRVPGSNLANDLASLSRHGGVCTHSMHSRSRMTVDPRTPTMPDGARRVFTDQADIAFTKREG